MRDEAGTHGAPGRLRCEYLTDPLGIDVPQPCLSWWTDDDRPAELQTAYHILAASHPDLLAMEEGDFWDTGRVEGCETTQIEYQGKPLVSGRRVWWKVRSFDSDGLPSPWSEPAVFEAGLLSPTDWQGRWISAGLVGSRLSAVPVPLFGRSFTLPQEVRHARLYLAARGQIALQLNDQPLDADALAPNWVDFARRAEYLTYDVSQRLVPGKNRLAVLLADGWFAGDPGIGYRQQYGERPQFVAQLNVTLADGRLFQLATDSGWRWQPSWILAADPTGGEQWDGVRRRRDWLDDGPDTFGWYPVVQGDRPQDDSCELTAAVTVARPAAASLPARRVRWEEDRCRALFEFPEPLLGRVRLSLTAPDAGAVRMRYGLSLTADGELDAASEDVCVVAGDEHGETVEAQFSLHGFRYVEVSGDLYREDAVEVAARPLLPSQEARANLATDHPHLNDLFDTLTAHLRRTQSAVAVAGLRPGDRMGEVAAVGSSMAARLLTLDGISYVTRWLTNMVDAQFPEGGFPAVVPVVPGAEALCGEGPAGASSTFVETLWHYYLHTGDRRFLRRHFPAVKHLLAGSAASTRELIREDLDAESGYPADLAATAWLYRSARLASRLAGVLGNLGDLEDCEELAGNVRNAFRRRFVTPDGRVVGDSVAVYALVLGLGLLDRTEQRRARQTLVAQVEAGLTTGRERRSNLLATPRLLAVLTEQGRLDLAYRLTLEIPVRPEPALGGRDVGRLVSAGVLEWLVSTLAGFGPSRDLSERHVAFRHMVIRPRPPLGLGYGDDAGEPPVRAVDAELDTENGRYGSSWRITETAFELSVRVPGNCMAEVVLPDGTGSTVDAGEHHFRMPFGEAGDGIPVLREVS